MYVTGIIPARYNSSRFQGKPLALIHGVSMIERVYTRAAQAASLNRVIVATDDSRIFEHVLSFGGNVIMTSAECRNGTERCLDAIQNIKKENKIFDCDVVVNIQGDEPFLHPEEIDTLVNCFSDPQVQIATLVRKISSSEDIFSNTVMKVVTDINDYALYFSRSAIPFIRDYDTADWINKYNFLKHIGIYGFRKETLENVTKLPPSALETAESLEQLRWLQNGFRIKTGVAQHDSFSIDTPDDLKKVEKLFSENH